MERRSKGSGNVTQVPCRWCGQPVAIDPPSMLWTDGHPFLQCEACDGVIAVRYNDAFRSMAPTAPPTTRPRSIFDRY